MPGYVVCYVCKLIRQKKGRPKSRKGGKMKTIIEVEFGRDIWDCELEELSFWDETYDLAKQDEEFFGKNVFIQTLSKIVDLPLIGWKESEAVYSDILQTLEYDPDCNIFQMFTYVEKKPDDYTGMFKYRKQGPTKAVPAYYVLIRFNFTEEVDVTNKIHASMKN